MTIKDRINQALTWETDEDKLIAIIYEIGKEIATRKICNEHNARVAKMRAAAKGHRYHALCDSIIDAGGPDIIYSPNYAGDILDTFGNDLVADYQK